MDFVWKLAAGVCFGAACGVLGALAVFWIDRSSGPKF